MHIGAGEDRDGGNRRSGGHDKASREGHL
jgi:hypothetical protein